MIPTQHQTVTFGYVHQSSDGCGISGKFRNIMTPIHSISNEKIDYLLQTIQTSEPHHSTILDIFQKMMSVFIFI